MQPKTNSVPIITRDIIKKETKANKEEELIAKKTKKEEESKKTIAIFGLQELQHKKLEELTAKETEQVEVLTLLLGSCQSVFRLLDSSSNSIENAKKSLEKEYEVYEKNTGALVAAGEKKEDIDFTINNLKKRIKEQQELYIKSQLRENIFLDKINLFLNENKEKLVKMSQIINPSIFKGFNRIIEKANILVNEEQFSAFFRNIKDFLDIIVDNKTPESNINLMINMVSPFFINMGGSTSVNALNDTDGKFLISLTGFLSKNELTGNRGVVVPADIKFISFFLDHGYAVENLGDDKDLFSYLNENIDFLEKLGKAPIKVSDFIGSIINALSTTTSPSNRSMDIPELIKDKRAILEKTQEFLNKMIDSKYEEFDLKKENELLKKDIVEFFSLIVADKEGVEKLTDEVIDHFKNRMGIKFKQKGASTKKPAPSFFISPPRENPKKAVTGLPPKVLQNKLVNNIVKDTSKTKHEINQSIVQNINNGKQQVETNSGFETGQKNFNVIQKGEKIMDTRKNKEQQNEQQDGAEKFYSVKSHDGDSIKSQEVVEKKKNINEQQENQNYSFHTAKSHISKDDNESLSKMVSKKGMLSDNKEDYTQKLSKFKNVISDNIIKNKSVDELKGTRGELEKFCRELREKNFGKQKNIATDRINDNLNRIKTVLDSKGFGNLEKYKYVDTKEIKKTFENYQNVYNKIKNAKFNDVLPLNEGQLDEIKIDAKIADQFSRLLTKITESITEKETIEAKYNEIALKVESGDFDVLGKLQERSKNIQNTLKFKQEYLKKLAQEKDKEGDKSILPRLEEEISDLKTNLEKVSVDIEDYKRNISASRLYSTRKDEINKIYDSINKDVKGIIKLLDNPKQLAEKSLKGEAKQIWEKIGNFFSSIWNKLKHFFEVIVYDRMRIIGGAFSATKKEGSDLSKKLESEDKDRVKADIKKLITQAELLKNTSEKLDERRDDLDEFLLPRDTLKEKLALPDDVQKKLENLDGLRNKKVTPGLNKSKSVEFIDTESKFVAKNRLNKSDIGKTLEEKKSEELEVDITLKHK